MTAWDSHLWRKGMNKWREASPSGFYVDLATPDPSDVKVALRYDIYRNAVGFGVDTVEFAGGAHYNGHPPNQTIGHWLAVFGYTNDAKRAKFADPSTSVWPAADKKFSYNVGNFTNTWLQWNGMTW